MEALRQSINEAVELDHRSCGWIDVSLFWNRASNSLFIQVIDWTEEEDFTIPVDPAAAMQAFHHPFAYAPSGHATYAPAA